MKTRYIDIVLSNNGLRIAEVSKNNSFNLASDQNQVHSEFLIKIATEDDNYSLAEICKQTSASAKERGTGISGRPQEYLTEKIKNGEAVIAYTIKGDWAGFCFISSWDKGRYASTSGLIVAPQFRHTGLAKKIKEKIFSLCREKYPDASIFSLTSGLAVMKMNHELGFEPVTYAELTSDDSFWKGCQSCINCSILESKNRKNCLCTAMLYDPKIS